MSLFKLFVVYCITNQANKLLSHALGIDLDSAQAKEELKSNVDGENGQSSPENNGQGTPENNGQSSPERNSQGSSHSSHSSGLSWILRDE